MSNKQDIRLIDCFFQPSSVFSIYDYTKIAYPIDGYICLRQICLPDSKPSFIKMQHQYEKVHSIHTYPNLIVTMQQNAAHEYSMGFYDSIHFHTKLSSSLANLHKNYINQNPTQWPSSASNLSFKVKYSNQYIFILFSLNQKQGLNHGKQVSKSYTKQTIASNILQPQQDNQLMVVNVKSKRVVSKNFFSGSVKQLFIKNNDNFTILYEDSTLVQYQFCQNLNTKQLSQSLYMMKKRQIQLTKTKSSNSTSPAVSQIFSHIWLKQQLIVVNEQAKRIEIYSQNKKTQEISTQAVKNIKSITPLMFGFCICNQNFIYIYKKVELSYLTIAQFFIRQIGFSPQLIFSPQEDILGYYLASKQAIQYILNFNDEIQKQMNNNKRCVRELKVSGQIKFQKGQNLQIYVNAHNNTFATSHQYTINLHSIINFQSYLEENLQSEESKNNSPVSKGRLKRLNTLGSVSENMDPLRKPQMILNIAIHPHSEIVAVALKNKIRVYQILYNELNHIKDIFVSNCSDMFFSNSGQFLSIVVNGKNGSKCYVYQTAQDFELLECLSIGKKVEKFLWSKFDTFLYGVHNSGYYRWSIEFVLKSRYETMFILPFKIIDAVLNDSRDKIIVYGENDILQINQKMQTQNQLNKKDIIKVQKTVKQIIFQNGSFFLNIITKNQSDNNEQMILKVDDLNNISFAFEKNNNINLASSKNKMISLYKESTGQRLTYKMVPCSGNCKKNIIFFVEENTKNIKLIQWGKTSSTENAKMLKNGDLIKIDRKNLKRIFKKYTKYEDDIRGLQQKIQQTIQHLKFDLSIKQQQKQRSFIDEIKKMQQKYQLIKSQKQKLQHTIEDKIQNHEESTKKQLKQLQKMYERKIAITTNKLLTSEEINYRNMLLAEENLKKLQKNANHDIQKIREQYKRQLTGYMNQKDYLAEQICRIKKQYESRLYDLQQQNQRILQQYQSKSQDQIQVLKRNLVGWEIRFSEASSKKDNFEKELAQSLINSQILKEKIYYLQAKNRQSNKKCEYLSYDIQKYEKMLDQKNTSISIYEERINDLEKSNQILKYRVIELKGETQPQSEQNQKLKQNLNELEQEYDKIVKTAFQKDQMLSIIKKESQKSRQGVQKLQSKVKKYQKSYLQLIDKVLNITKAPIQQIRKQLISLLNSIPKQHNQKSTNAITSSLVGLHQSPLGELNRIRQHLQVCLNEAVDSNQKGEKQKKIQITKKNRQNSQLIKQINDLRRKVKDFEATVKQKDIQINRIMRGDPIAVNEIKILKQNTHKQFSRQGHNNENQTQFTSLNHNQNNSRQNSRSHTRKLTRQTKESFFQKSLFKSSTHWRQKRLKTEQSQQRNTHSRSIKRNPSGKYLQIQSGTHEDIDDYKRIIEQKQTIIKQLINKIQSLS